VRWAALLLLGLPLLLLAAGLLSTFFHANDLSRFSFRSLRYALLVELALLFFFASVGAIYQARSNARDQRLYPPPGKLIDVGGYRLHLYCVGEGGPTVILDYGLSGSYLDWYFVQSEVARFTRVCSWDRGGYGWSDRSPKAQVPSAIAAELHTLLERAGERPPFILVGHSLGAFDVRMYAHLYPEQVAGVVLVDGSHPEENLTFSWRAKFWLRFMQFTTPFGLPRWRGWCTGGPEAIRPMKQAFSCRSKVFRAHYEQWSVFPQSVEEIRKLGSLGDLPLVVISRDPNTKQRHTDTPAPLEGEQRWQREQRAMAQLSSNSTFMVAEDSGHSVPKDRPDVVIKAIRQVVEEISKKTGNHNAAH
jgi:pimeloyl-ACP methyl ester carboxylesterase